MARPWGRLCTRKLYAARYRDPAPDRCYSRLGYHGHTIDTSNSAAPILCRASTLGTHVERVMGTFCRHTGQM